MTCSNCQTDNRDSARFCKRCGFWLLPDCPFCNTPLPEAALFCD
ncbi:MAG: zinc ribbon domain-containing protein, partial [Anaerolineae bacterium]|nr:zinc ribbon domain-containing protein [Anaerolineae bacterium]